MTTDDSQEIAATGRQLVIYVVAGLATLWIWRRFFR